MPLWKKLWLLFAVIWVVVAALNAITIVAFSEGAEAQKAWRPVALGLAVPALAYALAWLWDRWRTRRRSH
jgi:hypothetical protein